MSTGKRDIVRWVCKLTPICCISVVLQLMPGCSSWLEIHESRTSDISTSKRADGIAVNRPQEYEIKIEDDGLCRLVDTPKDCIGLTGARLVGVDHHHLLIINARRMPFSFAGLTLKTSDKQIAKEIGLESKTGAASVPKAASAALDAKTEREKIKLEAKEKEDQAKGQ